MYLTAEETLLRYSEQLGEGLTIFKQLLVLFLKFSVEPALKKFDKLRTVLIHDRYLRGAADEIALAKRLILIDSKVD